MKKQLGRGVVMSAVVAMGVATGARANAQQQVQAPPQTHALCSVVDSTRLVAGATLNEEGDERLVVQTLATAGAHGERYVVAVRDPSKNLRTGDAPVANRGADQLGFQGESVDAAPAAGGLTVVRMDAAMRRVGDAIHVADPKVAAVDGAREGIPVAVSVAGGVLVLERVGGDVWSVLVPATGDVGAPSRVTTLSGEHVAWITIAAQNAGAIALAGTDQGHVYALRFDRSGARIGEPEAWSQRVGGEVELLPTAGDGTGSLVALLARPSGERADGEVALQRVMIPLTTRGVPMNDPARVPPAPTPLPGVPASYVRSGNTVRAFAWSWPGAAARLDFDLSGREPKFAPIRGWNVGAPIEGQLAGHDATVTSAGVLYDVAIGADVYGAGLQGVVLRMEADSAPVVRRWVLPVRARLVAAPRVLPASDGVVVLLAEFDETGGGIDAFHVRCE